MTTRTTKFSEAIVRHNLTVFPVGPRGWVCARVTGVFCADGGGSVEVTDLSEFAPNPALAVEAWLNQWYNDCTAGI